MSRTAALLFALPLAACGGIGNNSTSATDAGAVGAEPARASIRGPGIEGLIELPRIDIDAADFELNGVKLYPGSTIRDFHFDASDRLSAKDEAKVTLVFESPASVEKVRDWFRDAMTRQGFKVSAQGDSVSGATAEGDPLQLKLEADGTERSRGTMIVGS